MADIKISALPGASTLTGTETIPLVQGGTTKKVTTDQFLIKDGSGNVGVGVTPSGNFTLQAKGSFTDGFKGFSLGGFRGGASGSGYPWVGYNIRLTGTHDVYNYDVGDVVSAIKFDSGIKFYTAPSGTAGNPISFTQAMTLDASGNLGVGNTTPVSKLDVLASGGVNSLHFGATANTDSGGYLNSSGSTEALLSGGANYNSYSAPNFVMKAKDTVASGVRFSNGEVNFWTDTGLTVGTTFNQSVKAIIDTSGNLIQTVNTTAATLSTNGTLTFSIVDNSTLRVSVRGSDGTTRTATLALT